MGSTELDQVKGSTRWHLVEGSPEWDHLCCVWWKDYQNNTLNNIAMIVNLSVINSLLCGLDKKIHLFCKCKYNQALGYFLSLGGAKGMDFPYLVVELVLFFKYIFIGQGIHLSKYNISKEKTKLYNEYSITLN